MSAGPHISHAPTPAPVPHGRGADDDAACHERQLGILVELAEAGLEVALALKARIVETAALEPDVESARACADLTRAFDRASRAVRMTIALRERVLKEAVPGTRETGAPAQETRIQRADRVRRIVGRVVREKHSHAEIREALDNRTRERLYDPDITGELKAPIGALVAQICTDLGLSPSWLVLAEEAWAQAEITERPAGSPYAAWPELPPVPFDLDDPDPDDDFEDEDELDDP